MKAMVLAHLTILCACLSLSGAVRAGDFNDIKQAIDDSKVKLNFRYRYEYVDQDPFEDEAGASTLRARLTWDSGVLGSWAAGVEADYVALVGNERYNSTENAKTDYPIVADPEGFDLNQAFIRYKSKTTTATAGRQRILHTDQRFLGGVGWRQNEQTFDAVRIEANASDRISLDYSYIWNINRIFGPSDGVQPADWHGQSHTLLAKINLSDGHNVEGFAYLLDFENDNGPPNATATYGLTYRGAFDPLSVAVTYASQSDYADSPLDYDADFLSLQAALKLKPLTLKAGYERLGSDGGKTAFRTPLATLHKWQGFADIFLNTPADGIEDVYVGLAGKLGPLKLAAVYHDFSADEGGRDFGDELDLIITYPLHKDLIAQLKFADYNADEFATDTTKVWLTLTAKF